ncbi:MFS transporter [Plantactinospora sp. GCM10030261]|uniref:MFS transporter n=1 Tax=Plantactinospora sp. GCM10030261 TaxID=3273420 RepID=UPI00361472A5
MSSVPSTATAGTGARRDGPAGGRTPILTRPFLALLVAGFTALLGFTLLLPVVPLYAATAGASAAVAGLTTGALMLATVVAELVVARLLAAFGYRAVLVAGVLLLTVPTVSLAVSDSIPLILAVSLTRGAGLGIVVVLGTALAAELAPAARRNEALGLYGLAVGIPWIVGLPLGMWLVDRVGFAPVFVVAAVCSLVGLVAMPWVPVRRVAVDRRHRGVLGGLRTGGLRRQVLIFAATTLAAGVFVTFLPLALPAGTGDLAAWALFAQAGAAPVTRWLAGRIGDRLASPRPLLVPSVLVAAVGASGAVWLDSPVAVLVGMALFGAGFGAAQTVTLALMLRRVSRSGFGQVSALWNLAYDGGMGIGAVGFGLLVGPVGYPVGFAVVAAVIFAAVWLAWRDGALDETPEPAEVRSTTTTETRHA